MAKLFVISLGGSLIVPEEINVKFLKQFQELIGRQIKKGNRFIISPGGGKTCRKYQAALKNIISAGRDDLDWIGLNTNKFHSKFLQLMFKNHAEKQIADDPNKKAGFTKPILIGAGGWKPGRSSDDFSIRQAKIYKADRVINLSNIDFVYTRDPRKYKAAKKIKKTSWKEFIKIIGSKWIPGKNVPFDPTAAKLALKNKIQVIICNGNNLKNLENILNGKKFIGTIIK